MLCNTVHSALDRIPSRGPRLRSTVRPLAGSDSPEVPRPFDDLARASPLWGGPFRLPLRFRSRAFSAPQRFPSRLELHGFVSRRYRPRVSPFRAFPSQKSRTPLGAACSLAVIHPRAGAHDPAPFTSGFADAHVGDVVAGIPRPLWVPFPRARARFPVALGSGTWGSPRSAGFTDFEASFLLRVRSRRPRSPPAAGRCSPGLTAPPETPPNLGPSDPRPPPKELAAPEGTTRAPTSRPHRSAPPVARPRGLRPKPSPSRPGEASPPAKPASQPRRRPSTPFGVEPRRLSAANPAPLTFTAAIARGGWPPKPSSTRGVNDPPRGSAVRLSWGSLPRRRPRDFGNPAGLGSLLRRTARTPVSGRPPDPSGRQSPLPEGHVVVVSAVVGEDRSAPDEGEEYSPPPTPGSVSSPALRALAVESRARQPKPTRYSLPARSGVRGECGDSGSRARAQLSFEICFHAPRAFAGSPALAPAAVRRSELKLNRARRLVGRGPARRGRCSTQCLEHLAKSAHGSSRAGRVSSHNLKLSHRLRGDIGRKAGKPEGGRAGWGRLDECSLVAVAPAHAPAPSSIEPTAKDANRQNEVALHSRVGVSIGPRAQGKTSCAAAAKTASDVCPMICALRAAYRAHHVAPASSPTRSTSGKRWATARTAAPGSDESFLRAGTGGYGAARATRR